MPNLFCCSSIQPYRPQRLDHERKFDKFMQWAKFSSAEPNDGSSFLASADYVVQLVKQVSYGPQESVRYFTTANDGIGFAEVNEKDLIAANFEKLNSYKNFKCIGHDKFFEVNLYQKNPFNTHHWRANIARPATDIDLVHRQKKEKSAQVIKSEDMKQQDHNADAERGTSSGSGLPDPTSQAHEAISQVNIPALKSVLRFLLPTVKINLGPNPLLSLLFLDWANTELSLGLEIEGLWDSELNSANVVTFLYNYIKLYAGNSSTCKVVEEFENENVAGLAISCADILKKDKIHGRRRFQEIVIHIFEICSRSDWVPKCQEGILLMFTAAPDEHLIKLGRRKEDEYEDTCIKMTSSADRDAGGNDHYNQYDYNDEYDYPNSDDYEASYSDFDKDLTACDKECGYCGRCPY
ncbi:hypothetical protein GGI35DRAFT_123535 [Trichoderma velutinum]